MIVYLKTSFFSDNTNNKFPVYFVEEINLDEQQRWAEEYRTARDKALKEAEEKVAWREERGGSAGR